MICVYAYGDGLGHLTRVRAFLHTRCLHTIGRDEPVTVLAPSPFAADPRVTGGWRVEHGDPVAALARLKPRELIVDAFPAGLRGELTAAVVPPGTRTVHLARLLRWDAYRQLLPRAPIRFDATYTLEPLEAAHRDHLRAVSAEVTALQLADPPSPQAARVGGWLVMHSGPDAEILELIGYAREVAALEGVRPELTLIAPARPAGLPADVAHLDLYPAWPLARGAERIFTAAGFNSVRQLAPWRERHRMLPFPRTLDDQFARAARVRSTSSTGHRSATS